MSTTFTTLRRTKIRPTRRAISETTPDHREECLRDTGANPKQIGPMPSAHSPAATLRKK